jgi:hypothetical protein
LLEDHYDWDAIDLAQRTRAEAVPGFPPVKVGDMISYQRNMACVNVLILLAKKQVYSGLVVGIHTTNFSIGDELEIRHALPSAPVCLVRCTMPDGSLAVSLLCFAKHGRISRRLFIPTK